MLQRPSSSSTQFTGRTSYAKEALQVTHPLVVIWLISWFHRHSTRCDSKLPLGLHSHLHPLSTLSLAPHYHLLILRKERAVGTRIYLTKINVCDLSSRDFTRSRVLYVLAHVPHPLAATALQHGRVKLLYRCLS